MRVRFGENGFEDYNPHEVLEQILFLVIPRANTNETAHALLRKFGSLSGVLDASPEQLTEVDGIGSSAAAFLASLKDGFLRAAEEEYRRSGQFGLYELAFLADLMLEPGSGKRFFLAVFDEEENFLRAGCVDTVRRPGGTPDILETARRIAVFCGDLYAVAVTADPNLFSREQAKVLFRTVQGFGCPLRQLLLTSDAALYDLMT